MVSVHTQHTAFACLRYDSFLAQYDWEGLLNPPEILKLEELAVVHEWSDSR